MVVDTVEVTLPLSVEDEGLVECISSLIPIYLLGCGALVLLVYQVLEFKGNALNIS